jgi:hypothetical protein
MTGGDAQTKIQQESYTHERTSKRKENCDGNRAQALEQLAEGDAFIMSEEGQHVTNVWTAVPKTSHEDKPSEPLQP